MSEEKYVVTIKGGETPGASLTVREGLTIEDALVSALMDHSSCIMGDETSSRLDFAVATIDSLARMIADLDKTWLQNANVIHRRPFRADTELEQLVSAALEYTKAL